MPLLGAGKAGEPAADAIDIFAPETHAGSGTVVYRQGGKVELIDLGPESGRYGLGIVYPAKLLPEAYREEFKGAFIIQIQLGTMASKLQEQVSQFGSMSLITKHIPTTSQTFQTKIRDAKTNNIFNLGLMMMTSPSAPREQADEQRLKSTYFAQSGSVIVTPLFDPREVKTENGSSTLQFKTQTMRLEFNSELSTPFSNEKAELQGKLEIPIYWPDSKSAELFTKKIAARSLAGMTAPPPPPPTGITQHPRSLAGSTKKDTTSSDGQ